MKRYLILSLLATHLTMANVQLQRSHFNKLPGWTSGHQALAIPALAASCRQELKLAPYRSPKSDIRATQAYQKSCNALLALPKSISNQAARYFLMNYFTPYLVTNNGNASGLFTGYYQPTVKGSLTPTANDRVPLYGRPDNLVKINVDGKLQYRLATHAGYTPVPTRKQIFDGPLLKETPVLAWVHSDVERFFMQIQGSGSVLLSNGKTLLLGYAGQTGHRYYPIGRYLVQSGKIPVTQISMQTIRQWLQQHPNQAEHVMNMNPSFVFFKKLTTREPIGAEGIPLTPRRSLAIDPQIIPLGLPLWLNTYLPALNRDHSKGQDEPFDRLMIAQDTGGAIQGPIRGDVFWGTGKRARWMAGHMQSTGCYWILLPKGANPDLIS